MKTPWKRQRGSETVEMALVILPLLGFMFLIFDCAWVIFAKAAVQNAVREGVRYAVTSQTMAGLGQDNSIRTVVQQNACGFLNGVDGARKISISYYDPNSLAATALNAGGNIVEVSVAGLAIAPLGPILRDSTAIQLSARSSDVMEGSPGGIPPVR